MSDGITILGLGKAVPNRIITNEELSTWVDTSDEWIYSRTGIKARHVAMEETTVSLATEAGREAIMKAKLQEAIQLVIVATASPDYLMPSTACQVAHHLELTQATCFDVNAACSGFIYASKLAISLMKSGGYENALVIGAETLSKRLDYEDRGTCVLFADGAGAVVYKKTEKNHIYGINIGSDCRGSEEIILPSNIPDTRIKPADKILPYLQMEGKGVYAFSTKKAPEIIKETLDEIAINLEQINWFVLHQANVRIMDAVAKRLSVPNEHFIKNLERHGNTGAATIPIALYDHQHLFNAGELLVLCGFGAGLCWGTMVIEWPKGI